MVVGKLVARGESWNEDVCYREYAGPSLCLSSDHEVRTHAPSGSPGSRGSAPLAGGLPRRRSTRLRAPERRPDRRFVREHDHDRRLAERSERRLRVQRRRRRRRGHRQRWAAGHLLRRQHGLEPPVPEQREHAVRGHHQVGGCRHESLGDGRDDGGHQQRRVARHLRLGVGAAVVHGIGAGESALRQQRGSDVHGVRGEVRHRGHQFHDARSVPRLRR